jgi:hypothetical protein
LICFQFSFSLLFLLMFLFSIPAQKTYHVYPHDVHDPALALYFVRCSRRHGISPFFFLSLKELKALIRNRRFLRQQNLSFISYILPPSTKKYALEHKHINP